MAKLYVSYVRDEIGAVQPVLAHVKKVLSGVDVSFSHTVNEPALESADVILCLFSADHKKSEEFCREVELACNLNKRILLLEYKKYGFFARLFSRRSALKELRSKLRTDSYDWNEEPEQEKCLRLLCSWLGAEEAIGKLTGNLVQFQIISSGPFYYTIAGQRGSCRTGRTIDVRLDEGRHLCIFSPTADSECIWAREIAFVATSKSVVVNLDEMLHKKEAEERAKAAAQKTRREAEEKAQREARERKQREAQEKDRLAREAQEASKKFAGKDLSTLFLEGVKHEEAQDYAKAYDIFKYCAEQGMAIAMDKLGFFHYNGLYVNKSEETAVIWFRTSADAGNLYGMYDLAWCYLKGKGVRQDAAAGRELLQRAANLGLEAAKKDLENM